MFVVTTDEIPGYRIASVQGHVLGTIVRTLTPGDGFSASFDALAGGELAVYSRLMWQNRQEAINRMWAEAEQRGANAVVGLRIDSAPMNEGLAEVTAVGTAVTIEPA